MRLAFMGTPDFAVPALEALIASHHDVVAVYTQPPRPAGRGKAPRKTPVHLSAEAAGIPVFTPENFKDASDRTAFAAHQLDAAIVAAYGLILPVAILDAPRFGCLNIHASLLPRWRGAAPVHRAIMAGDDETGVGIMQMEKGLDTGPLWLEKRLTIASDHMTETLTEDLAHLGADALLHALPLIAAGTRRPTPQAADGIVYAHKIDKAEALIDWTQSARQIERQIRGLAPFPGAWTDISGQRVKIFAARVEAGDTDHVPGTVLDDALLVACGEGTALRLTLLQRAGKSRQDGATFLRGFAVAPGMVCGADMQ